VKTNETLNNVEKMALKYLKNEQLLTSVNILLQSNRLKSAEKTLVYLEKKSSMSNVKNYYDESKNQYLESFKTN